MPLSTPATQDTLAIEDRLRSLLAADSTLTNLYSGAIRTFPLDSVDATTNIVLAVFVCDEDDTPQTMDKERLIPRFIAQIIVSEPQEFADPAAIRRKLVNLTNLVRRAIWKYRRDPTAGTPLWYAIRFKQNPTTTYQRRAQEFQQSLTQFEIRTEKANP